MASEAKNGHSEAAVLSASSEALVTALRARKDLIHWASAAIQLYEAIGNGYTKCATPSAANNRSELEKRIVQLERYLTLDLTAHIASKNGRTPYYFDPVKTHLEAADRLLEAAGKLADKDSRALIAQSDHLAAEFQSTFNEYGFCHACNDISEVDEAMQKVEALSLRLGKVEKRVENNNEDPAASLSSLQEVEAVSNGMQQAMTEASINKLKAKFDTLTRRVDTIQQGFGAANIKSDSEFFLQYLACQHLLGKPFVKAVKYVDPSAAINQHMIHPGTRSWALDRFQRWLSTEKRLFFIAGKEGSGKTALSSAICKLYSPSAIASYFCTEKSDANNTMNSLLQAIAAQLLISMPEYLNWMDDKYGDNAGELTKSLSDSTYWSDLYQLLLKNPLNALYGAGGNSSNPGHGTRRRVIVIDGVDRLSPGEWPNIKSMLTMMLKDLPSCLCVLVTARTEDFKKLVPVDYDLTEGVGLEEKPWSVKHIQDLEIYLSSSMGAILSGEDHDFAPYRIKADPGTLQDKVDDFIKHTGGRFDFAISLMEKFSEEMAKSNGQFLTSVQKALPSVIKRHGVKMEDNIREFSSPFRSYRNTEGRPVDIRILRQNQYLQDKTRHALIRGRCRLTYD